MLNKLVLCKLCGDPTPVGEEMFKYHGYSGECPKPPLKAVKSLEEKLAEAQKVIAEKDKRIEWIENERDCYHKQLMQDENKIIKLRDQLTSRDAMIEKLEKHLKKTKWCVHSRADEALAELSEWRKTNE